MKIRFVEIRVSVRFWPRNSESGTFAFAYNFYFFLSHTSQNSFTVAGPCPAYMPPSELCRIESPFPLDLCISMHIDP